MLSLSKVAAVVALGASLLQAVSGAPARNNALDRRAPTTDKKVIIQMFEWNWDSVASECTDFIGPAGYGFVQGEPPLTSLCTRLPIC